MFALACRTAVALMVAGFIAAAIPHGWHAVAERAVVAAAAWGIAESAGREAGRLYLTRATKRRPKRH